MTSPSSLRLSFSAARCKGLIAATDPIGAQAGASDAAQQSSRTPITPCLVRSSRLKRPIPLNNDPMHRPAVALVIIQGVMKQAPIVPNGKGPFGPG